MQKIKKQLIRGLTHFKKEQILIEVINTKYEFIKNEFNSILNQVFINN